MSVAHAERGTEFASQHGAPCAPSNDAVKKEVGTINEEMKK
ncbi:MAG: hypothetical protein QOC81_597 [Thermoanaerobaculia bacterium]|jgi:hypothetical protein|nr:hypothetical protein [Thermoanaerobaculia bacterium]